MYKVVGTDGQVYGPADIATLQQWCQEGRIVPDTNLIDPQDGRVFAAQHLPQLSGFFVHTQSFGTPPQTPGSFGGASPQGPFDPGPTGPGSFGQGVSSQGPYNQSPFGHGPFGQGPMPQTSYPRHPMGRRTSPKQKSTALVLAVLLGFLGAHRFYLGHTATGLAMLVLTFVGCICSIHGILLWVIVDAILIATDQLRDADGGYLS